MARRQMISPEQMAAMARRVEERDESVVESIKKRWDKEKAEMGRAERVYGRHKETPEERKHRLATEHHGRTGFRGHQGKAATRNNRRKDRQKLRQYARD